MATVLGDVLEREHADLGYEVVDDQVLELDPMSAFEVCFAFELGCLLAAFGKQHQLGQAVTEMLFDFSAKIGRKRRPDVAFVSYARWPRGRMIPRTEAWDVVPNLAVEIVSRNNTAEEIMGKVSEYFQVGVESVWVVYPVQRVVYVYTSATSVRIISDQEELAGEPVLAGFRFRPADLFGPVEAPAV